MKHKTEKSFIAKEGTKSLVIEERFLVNSKVGSLLKKLDKAGFSTISGGDGIDLRKLDNSIYDALIEYGIDILIEAREKSYVMLEK